MSIGTERRRAEIREMICERGRVRVSEISRKMISSADQVIVVADSSKLGKIRFPVSPHFRTWMPWSQTAQKTARRSH